jgi:CRP-like cAMP-binding protein
VTRHTQPGSKLLTGVPGATREFLDSVSEEVSYDRDDVIFAEGGEAERFYLIQSGKVSLEVTSPGRPLIAIQTLGSGDLLGLSWLFPPHRWAWRARALEPTTVLAFDAGRVRARCETDEQLFRTVLEVIAEEAVRRLHNSRLHLLDLYQAGSP